MNAVTLLRFARWFSLAVGLLDFGTGAGLVLAPGFTLQQMGATVPGGEALAFVRFVGAFVAAVGAAYLWAFATRDAVRLRVTLLVTLFFRGAAGLYTGVAVATGIFDPAWLMVTATDLGCVALQAWLLVKGVGRDA
jgi:hypothetical protein